MIIGLTRQCVAIDGLIKCSCANISILMETWKFFFGTLKYILEGCKIGVISFNLYLFSLSTWGGIKMKSVFNDFFENRGFSPLKEWLFCCCCFMEKSASGVNTFY